MEDFSVAGGRRMLPCMPHRVWARMVSPVRNPVYGLRHLLAPAQAYVRILPMKSAPRPACASLGLPVLLRTARASGPEHLLGVRSLHWSAALCEAPKDKPKDADPAHGSKDEDTKPPAKDAPHEPEKQDMFLQKQSSAHDLVETPSKSLFQNYPRSLRDLALKARSFARARAEDVSAVTSGTSRGSGAARNKPTQEDLLRIARGFWTRMRIRFKWFTIRGFRRFNVDEISAFFTLGGLGTAIWVIVGTYVYGLTQNNVCLRYLCSAEPA